MKSYLIQNASIVNEGKTTVGDVLIQNGRIKKIGENLLDTADETITQKGST